MKEIDLEKLHDKTYELALEFHKICKKYHLRYYMIGGTMLGAYREKDFIPWDDDMDIGMPRRDYDKLMSIRKKIKSEILSIEYPDSEEYPWSYARVFHRKTTMIQGMYNYLGGIFIDLYPLDNAGATKISRFIHQSVFNWYGNKIQMSTSTDRYHLKNGDNRLKSLTKRGSLYWKIKRETFLRNISGHRTRYLANYYGIYFDKEIMPAKVFGRPKLYNFRDAKLYGVEDANYYLTRLYGPDYMTPPPPTVRKNTRHACKYISFEEPYEEYRRK